MKQDHSILLFAQLFLLFTSTALGELKFSRHYTDDMVLQREKPILIRGFSKKGSAVTVTLGGQSKETKTAENGEWVVTLNPMPASGKGQTLKATSSSHSIEINNVWLGDIFLFARQTSIDMSLASRPTGREAASELPSLRVLTIQSIPASEPQQDLVEEATVGWTPLTKEASLKMDAAAFHMAKGLADMEIPVGIININMGRHFPIGWMSKEASLESEKIFPKKGNQVMTVINMMDEYKNPSENRIYKDSNRPYPRPPAEEDARFPAAGYNAVLYPMRGLSVKALLVQMGNSYPYYPYADLKREGKHTNRAFASQAFGDCYDVRKWGLYIAPITTPRIPVEWRSILGGEAIPFGWITPPGSDLDTLAKHHRAMRELQRLTADQESSVDLILPGTESIPMSAQPADDALLGKRCLAWIQSAVYKKDGLPATGPLFERVEINGNEAQVFFKPGTAMGLKATGEALNQFEVAAATVSDNPNIAPNQNLIYSKAKASIDGETILLSSDTIKNIAYVRYNWKEKPNQELTGGTGLPAFPFTTDGNPFPRRISSNPEEKPPEFFMSIVDWKSDGPVMYDGDLQTGLTNGRAFGPTGIRGTPAFGKNLFVNNTYVGSPASGRVFNGDYIYGVNGKAFENIRQDMAKAIILAESEAGEGVMSLMVLRKGKRITVDLQLEVLGTYSETSPYDCPKTKRLVSEAETMLERLGVGYKAGNAGSVYSNPEAMFLLATGTPKVQGLVRSHVYNIMANYKRLHLEKPIDNVGKYGASGPWRLSADMLFLSEYYLATGDKNVFPYLKHMCDALTNIQIRHPDEKGPWPKVQNLGQMGGWRHNFYGGAGYGTMPAIGVPAVLGYHLSKEAGVEYNFLGYDRAVHWFHHNGAQIGRIMYGYFANPLTKRDKPLDPDKLAAGKLSPGNGGVAGAAILFDLLENEKIAKVNAHVAKHTYNNTHYAHGGHFWANFYGPLGPKVESDEAFQFFMKGYRDYKTLTRMPNFSREFGYGHYIADVAPRERLRILGAHESVFSPNPPKVLDKALEAYHGRNYAEAENFVKSVLKKGGLSGLDLKKAEQLRDAAKLIQESLALDLAKVQYLIKEKKPYEAGLELAQLQAISPEGHPELQDIVTALNAPEMKQRIREDRNRLNAYRASFTLELSEAQEAVGPEWEEIVSQSRGRSFAFTSKKPNPTLWRMKVIESLDQAPEGWTENSFEDTSWSEVMLPINWRENHTIILRTTFDIEDPAAVGGLRFNQYAKHLRNMQVFINGQPVAKISAVASGRVVNIPLNDQALKLLKKGQNTLSATYKNNTRWGGRGKADRGGLNITMDIQGK